METIERTGRRKGGCGERIDTYPQASAPDPHVPLLHDVIKIGSHPGRPATPHPGARARGGSGAGSGPGREQTWGEKVDTAKRLRRRLGAALEGAHHFVCPPTPKVGGRLAATSGERGARRGEAGAPPSADSSAGLPGGGAAAAQGSSPASSRGPRGGGRGGGGEGGRGKRRRTAEPPPPPPPQRPAAATRGQTPLSAPHPSPPLPPTWPDPLPLPIPPLLPDPERAPARPHTSRTACREHAPSLLAPVFDFRRRGNFTLCQPPPTTPLQPHLFPGKG